MVMSSGRRSGGRRGLVDHGGVTPLSEHAPYARGDPGSQKVNVTKKRKNESEEKREIGMRGGKRARRAMSGILSDGNKFRSRSFSYFLSLVVVPVITILISVNCHYYTAMVVMHAETGANRWS